jgi:hypothetical protein
MPDMRHVPSYVDLTHERYMEGFNDAKAGKPPRFKNDVYMDGYTHGKKKAAKK